MLITVQVKVKLQRQVGDMFRKRLTQYSRDVDPWPRMRSSVKLVRCVGIDTAPPFLMYHEDGIVTNSYLPSRVSPNRVVEGRRLFATFTEWLSGSSESGLRRRDGLTQTPRAKALPLL